MGRGKIQKWTRTGVMSRKTNDKRYFVCKICISGTKVSSFHLPSNRMAQLFDLDMLGWEETASSVHPGRPAGMVVFAEVERKLEVVDPWLLDLVVYQAAVAVVVVDAAYFVTATVVFVVDWIVATWCARKKTTKQTGGARTESKKEKVRHPIIPYEPSLPFVTSQLRRTSLSNRYLTDRLWWR